MRSAEFNAEIASAYRVDLKTVTLCARFLKEAGLLTTGARGVNAPHMTPLDAARMTIALLATDSPSRAVEMLLRFRGMVHIPERSNGPLPAYLEGAAGSTFEVALTILFSGAHLSNLSYVEVQENDRSATLNHEEGEMYFRSVGLSEDEHTADRKEHGGIRRRRGVAASEIMKIAVHFHLEQRIGFDWKERTAADLEAISGEEG